jgi:hypothetical protein
MQTRSEAETILAKFDIWEDLGTKTREELIDWLLTGPGRAIRAGDEEVFENALFDEAIFLDEGWAECPSCGHEMSTRKPPAASDELAWKRVAEEHTQRCVKTRAGQVVPEKSAAPLVRVRKKTPALRVVPPTDALEF